MPRSHERSHTFLGLAMVGAIGVVGAIGARNAFTDGRGKTNFNIGPYNHGKCAEVINSPDIRHPSTDYQLLSSVQAIGRACGFCFKDQVLSNGGVNYNICVDPETIETDFAGDSMTTKIIGYLTTEPKDAPKGYIYAALDANPGFCSATITGIENEMNGYFKQAFDSETLKSLAAVVHIAKGSNSACETATLVPATTIV